MKHYLLILVCPFVTFLISLECFLPAFAKWFVSRLRLTKREEQAAEVFIRRLGDVLKWRDTLHLMKVMKIFTMATILLLRMMQDNLFAFVLSDTCEISSRVVRVCGEDNYGLDRTGLESLVRVEM